MPESDYTPGLEDIAAILQTRLRGFNGNVATFTDDTAPTAAQVQSIIDGAVGKLEAKFGADVLTELVASAKEVAKYRSAMLVEISFFADQITVDRGGFQELKGLYEEALADFVLDRKQLGADQEAGTADDLSAAGLPASIPASVPSAAELIW